MSAGQVAALYVRGDSIYRQLVIVYGGGWSAPKATWLYIVGCDPADIPGFALRLGVAPGRVSSMGKAERERTPEAFARWLVDLAGRCAGGRQ